mmetsp:Transcript_1109/g.3259  ORF Transcript_1109/g.3259 Transcript_1109/m.3259 type:complete len:215 (-) Transcript_1109:1115-1759(-)
MSRGVAVRKEEYVTLLAVGMICPPLLWIASSAIVASKSLNLTLLMGSSHSGPSLAPHWKPWITEFLTAFTRLLSTSEAKVSSNKAFAPCFSGPKAHTDLPAMTSHSYLSSRYFPILFLGHSMSTTPFSMSSANPLSKGSATIVSLFLLLGVSAKHLIAEVSRTVSVKETTGSATLTSMLLYISLRSLRTQSKYSSPVPRMVCSPLSSTFVTAKG